MKPMPAFSEQVLESLETRIPQMAQTAFSHAHFKALTISGKVVQTIGDQLVELSAEGTVRVLKGIAPPLQVQVGTKRVRKVSK